MSSTCRCLCVLVAVTLAVECAGERHYFIYTVNPGEGFNLRRDVHMRAANFLLSMRRKGQDWVMVLPPWPHLYHWQSRDGQQWLPWSTFFDINSLSEYIPSIEFEEFIAQSGTGIDEVLYLTNAEWTGGEFTSKCEERNCPHDLPLFQRRNKYWGGAFFGHDEVSARTVRCFSALGMTSALTSELDRPHLQSVMVMRMEIFLHEEFGGVDYWNARSSMVYSQRLRVEGNRFMRETLHYDPGEGNGRQSPKNGGGRYLSVHLRRKDYLGAHYDLVPSLEGAAAQIRQLMKEEGLRVVFLSTDAPTHEKKQLKSMVPQLLWYQPSTSGDWYDGEVAIIDQWIAAHASYFVGTAESTFSFRIREDRQLMGMSERSTFNQLCGRGHNDKDPHSCPGPSVWLMPPATNTRTEL